MPQIGPKPLDTLLKPSATAMTDTPGSSSDLKIAATLSLRTVGSPGIGKSYPLVGSETVNCAETGACTRAWRDEKNTTAMKGTASSTRKH